MLGGIGGNAVVTAGGTTVSPNEFRLAYDRQLTFCPSSSGSGSRASRRPRSASTSRFSSQLVAGAVLDEQARKMGLGLSKDQLADLTARGSGVPGRRTASSTASSSITCCGRSACGRDDYLSSRGQVAMRQQIVEAVSDGLKAPDTFLRAVALYRGEDRTVDYLVLPKSLVEPIEEPAADVLTKWFEENKKTYAAPEYRKISYVKLEPEDIADAGAITDEQVKADYEATRRKFTDAGNADDRTDHFQDRRKRRRPRTSRSTPARRSRMS